MEFLFSQTLKRSRENQNLSAEELSKNIKFTLKMYSEMESDKRYPNIFTLRKLANLLNTTTVNLLTGLDIDVPLSKLELTSKEPFSLWYYKWMDVKSKEITFTPVATYSSDAQYVLKAFRNKPLCSITWEDVNNYIQSKTHLSKRTLRDHKTLIKLVYSFAKACKQYDYNPAIDIKIPKEARKPAETKTITAQSKKMIMEFEHEMQLPAVIMLLAGLRRGELLTLTFGDIHLLDGYISVNKVTEMHNGVPYVVDRAKSEMGVRNVDIPNTLCSFILNYIGKHPEKKPTDLIISNHFGKPLGANGFQKKWNDYIASMNLHYGNFTKSELKAINSIDELPLHIERFTSKQLRHTYATMLYFSKTDVLIAKEQLGHSSITTTLNFYCHMDRKYKRKNITLFDNFLSEEAFAG